MLIHPHIHPVAFQVGPLAVHWYGLMYLVAFGAFYYLALQRVRHPQFAARGWLPKDIEDLLFFGVLGVIIGGRLGYVLFYKPTYYLGNPIEALQLWKGGMAFHGGLLGVVIAMAWFAWLRKRSVWDVTDLIAPCVPLGLAAGRLGNFINGELWGRIADPSLPWAMLFRNAGDLPRHPSQLYQMALEGLLLFVILWWFARKPRGLGEVSGAFLVGYGVFRFTAEYFRQPDNYLGTLWLDLSMGQWLCVPMVLVGVGLGVWGYRRRGAAA